ncbi:hypothetical protein B0T11DRAFT_1305 [Plectosphaerella cucumerina]|uniref:Uncharacterized protein n=1 Tax=Plectosphaerella cucumerina TaxID=40658 RepID=A0A8K0TNM5_9PEZI|nr:hypothetical protein B0T11DRAFT_1305 [Plectosphaerella cucumerina]
MSSPTTRAEPPCPPPFRGSSHLGHLPYLSTVTSMSNVPPSAPQDASSFPQATSRPWGRKLMCPLHVPPPQQWHDGRSQRQQCGPCGMTRGPHYSRGSSSCDLARRTSEPPPRRYRPPVQSPPSPPDSRRLPVDGAWAPEGISLLVNRMFLASLSLRASPLLRRNLVVVLALVWSGPLTTPSAPPSGGWRGVVSRRKGIIHNATQLLASVSSRPILALVAGEPKPAGSADRRARHDSHAVSPECLSVCASA